MSAGPRSTVETARDYEKAPVDWEALTTRVVTTLRRRGVLTEDAEDAAQEAVTRALVHAVPYVDDDDLYRWLVTVAGRVAVDGIRVRCRTSGGEVPERAAAVDVATTVEARARLAAVTRAFSNLSEPEQAALRDGVAGDVLGPPTSIATAEAIRRTAVRVAVRRHRARARLSAMTQRFAGSGLVIRFRDRLVLTGENVASGFAAPLLAAGLALAGTSGAGGAGGTVDRSDDRAAEVVAASVTVPGRVGGHGTGQRDPLAVGLVRTAAPAPSPRPLPDGRFPAAAIAVPDGAPTDGRVGTRPRNEDDHDVCADIVVDATCFDLPAVPSVRR